MKLIKQTYPKGDKIMLLNETFKAEIAVHKKRLAKEQNNLAQIEQILYQIQKPLKEHHASSYISEYKPILYLTIHSAKTRAEGCKKCAYLLEAIDEILELTEVKLYHSSRAFGYSALHNNISLIISAGLTISYRTA